MIEVGIIAATDMIMITSPAIIKGGMTNEEFVQIRTGAGRDIKTIHATIKGRMLEERSVGNWRRIINGSRIETSLVANRSNEE